MPIRVAINGFGRIGRLCFRAGFHHSEIDIVAINDLVSADNLAYLLKYDTIHGQFPENVIVKDNSLVVNDQIIQVLSEKDPSKLPWKKLNIDYVIESTGFFTHAKDAKMHLDAGAKRVIISAPSKGDIPTLVMGVNNTQFDPSKDFIVSNASCTTNCLAPITKVLLDNFGIEEGLMTTVHALTSTQPTVDSPSEKDHRKGRGAGQNIIPASTGAAKAVSLCIPEVKGKLTGMAFRVPVPDVSVVDLTVRLSRSTSYDEICKAMKKASDTSMKGIICYCEDPVVSSDFIGSPYSAIFDKTAGIALNDKFYKIISWYDNEMGYATRIIDLAIYMASKETSKVATVQTL